MANNPYVNKVIYGNNTVIDLSTDTVTASDVASGKTFHLPSGEPASGTLNPGSLNPSVNSYLLTRNVPVRLSLDSAVIIVSNGNPLEFGQNVRTRFMICDGIIIDDYEYNPNITVTYDSTNKEVVVLSTVTGTTTLYLHVFKFK